MLSLDHLLFHRIYDGPANRIVRACSPEQHACIASFLAYLMEQHSVELDEGIFRSDDILKAFEMWSAR